MLSTWLTDTFDLSVPVVCAPMAGVAGGRLAAAVSAAGALGMVGWGSGDADALRGEADLARSGGRPFGVGLLGWVLETRPELLEAALESGPALVSVSFGPYAASVERVRSAGALFATQVGTVAEAVDAQAAGVDVIVARGGEGGGHGRDAVASLPLLQQVLDAVEVPVLAAGGIGGPRGVAAVLAAGAAGAWVGTAFTACPESAGSPESKASVVAAGADETVYTTVLDIGRGVPWPAEYGGRAIRHPFAERWHGRDDELRAAGEKLETPAVWAGQAAGLVVAEHPAAEVVAALAKAEQLIAGAARLVR